MHHLVEANLSIRNLLQWEDIPYALFNFIRIFSHVQHLHLSQIFMSEFGSLGEEGLKDHLPVFPNLKLLALDLYDGIFWDRFILPLLNCLPGIEMPYNPGNHYLARAPSESQRDFFTTAHAIPPCCRNHLKRVVIKQYSGVELEVIVVQFLLRHALVLEELVVCLYKKSPLKQSAENTLKNLPKASVTCSIQVS
ncbi:hypothetical protein RDABS01_006910 [Bienertia sinuspersici]